MAYKHRLINRAVHGVVQKNLAFELKAVLRDAINALEPLAEDGGDTMSSSQMREFKTLYNDLVYLAEYGGSGEQGPENDAKFIDSLKSIRERLDKVFDPDDFSEAAGDVMVDVMVELDDAISAAEEESGVFDGRSAPALVRRAPNAEQKALAAVVSARQVLESASDSVRSAIQDVRTAIRTLKGTEYASQLASNMDAYLRPWLETMLSGDRGGGTYLEDAVTELEELEDELDNMDEGDSEDSPPSGAGGV